MFMHGRLCYLGLSLERSKLCVQSSQFTYLRGRPQLRSRGFRFATRGFFIYVVQASYLYNDSFSNFRD